ncbi:MAG: hypothetical protein RLP02_30215 [Coleofasciculus sp. C2-GNP5-27]
MTLTSNLLIALERSGEPHISFDNCHALEWQYHATYAQIPVLWVIRFKS